MLKLLTSARSIRNLAGTVTAAVRSVVAPASLMVEAQPVTATDPTGLFEADDMPPVEDIERAALGYDLACDSARSADRTKRKHRRLLDKLPTGLYGGWLVSRETSNRQVADLEEIRRIFKQHNWGAVPMRSCAASLKVTRAEVSAEVAA